MSKAALGLGIVLGGIPSLLSFMAAQNGTQLVTTIGAIGVAGLLVGGKDSGTVGRGIMYGSLALPAFLGAATAADFVDHKSRGLPTNTFRGEDPIIAAGRRF